MNTYPGAIVFVASRPPLRPLAMYRRRRGKPAVAASPVQCGIDAAVGSGI